MRIDFGGGQDVAFFQQGCAGIICLTRPLALNALNQIMTDAITRAFEVWAEAGQIALVLIEGDGRAFCAGGDVVSVWHDLKAGKDARHFFASEYRLNRLIGHFPKPCISFLNGFVMGGGAGLSMHGSHRLVTENTSFAMPEAGIGFFPDVGMGSLLARLPDHFGLYLALTGTAIAQGDCLQLGLATHAIAAKDIPSLRQQLIDKGDVGVLDEIDQHIGFETSVADRAMIGKCFCADKVETIIDRLKEYREGEDDFASRTLALLQARSPLSLKIIHKHLALSGNMTLDECLRLDYHLARYMLAMPDFYEGVRARLVDKDNEPNWQPARLDLVSSQMIDACFVLPYQELD